MGINETPIQMVSRHVLEGEKHIADQRALIERLRRRGLPIDEALAFLERLHLLQAQHEEHLRRIQEERELGLRDEQGNLFSQQQR